MSEALGGGEGLEVVSLSLKGAPPHTPQHLSHLSHQPDGLRFRTLFTTLLLELKFGENGAPGDGRTCNPLMPVHVLERSHFFDKYAKMSGNRPKREPFWDSSLARKSIKNVQNWCLGHPGCRIEGKGAIWDAKWRGKDRLGEQNGGKNERFGSTVAEPALAHWIRRARRSLPLGV